MNAEHVSPWMDEDLAIFRDNEYLVCRVFADARVQRIYGGTNEIVKEVISHSR